MPLKTSLLLRAAVVLLPVLGALPAAAQMRDVEHAAPRVGVPVAAAPLLPDPAATPPAAHPSTVVAPAAAQPSRLLAKARLIRFRKWAAQPAGRRSNLATSLQ
jgi:hypothetical protein